MAEYLFLWNNYKRFPVRAFSVSAAWKWCFSSQAPNCTVFGMEDESLSLPVGLTELGPRVAGWQQNKELPEECVLPSSESGGLEPGAQQVFLTLEGTSEGTSFGLKAY